MYDRQEGRRRAKLRASAGPIVALCVLGAVAGGVVTALTHTHTVLFVVVGAVFPLAKLLPTPQHIAAWGSGAEGERAVGAKLESLRAMNVFSVHDRRVPGRRTNIDHIAVSPAGIFVIDTKNVRGKVTISGRSVRVAGRRKDTMIEGVQSQLAVVREALADQALPPQLFHGVLCFTQADLPWLRPSPGGVALLYPRGLARALSRPGPLSTEQVRHLATLLATRLPAA